MRGGKIIPFSVAIFLVLVLWYLMKTYQTDIRDNLYQYKNVEHLGVIIYLISLLVAQISFVLSKDWGISAIRSMLNSISFFAHFALPAAFVLSILVTISNIKLMKNEGVTWRNMLGCILGILLCAGTITPDIIGEILQRSTVVDVHNERGAALYIEMVAENSALTVVTYLEYILLATVILGIKAARKIPSFDKDYILILGCQINKDGTLTALLKGRADRAIEFAKMQKEQAGKDIIFVPSGGQGSDEVISEGEAIKRYLIETGIPTDRILEETKSVNTFENLGRSMEIIKNNTDKKEPKIAFSTTNYHVFRAGVFATQQGIRAEGIGSKTKRYFWVNAFIREFVATLRSEWKTHLMITTVMLVIMLLTIQMMYLSAVL